MIDQLLRKEHQLQRELITAEAVHIPAGDAVRHAERTLTDEVGILALVRLFSNCGRALDKNEL